MVEKRFLAPIIITIVLIIYFSGFLLVALSIINSLWLKILGIIIPLGFITLSIYALIQRIKEIRSGEEDDLSKY